MPGPRADAGRGRGLCLGTGYLDVVARPDDVDAVARALLGRADDVQAQTGRDVGALPRCGEQVAGLVLDVGEPVDVELEHLRRVLHTQPIAGAQLLVDPDLQILAGCPAHAVPAD